MNNDKDNDNYSAPAHHNSDTLLKKDNKKGDKLLCEYWTPQRRVREITILDKSEIKLLPIKAIRLQLT